MKIVLPNIQEIFNFCSYTEKYVNQVKEFKTNFYKKK